MMRYEKGRKDVTRQRILDTATEQFKIQGIAGVGLKTIMQDAGLTNGAFYGHFPSKDALVRDSVDAALEVQRDQLRELADVGGLEAVLRHYLSEAHRDEHGKGCPSAALLPEIGRQTDDVRCAYTEQFAGLVAVIADFVPGRTVDNRERMARSLFALAIGSLQLARAVNDPFLSSEILEGAIQSALQLTGV